MKKINVLIEEDNEADVFTTRQVRSLSDITANIVVARDGAEAIDCILETTTYKLDALPYLVMLDINLPKLNGKKVLSFIKSNPKYNNSNVVMYTSSNLETDILFCYKAEVNLYLNKPSAINEFDKIVATLVFFKTQNFAN